MESIFSLSRWPSVEKMVQANGQQSEDIMNAFLQQPSVKEPSQIFLIIAILHALGED
jgi:hypothetical protein